ncbi:unnamed protein product [Amoebophrya sp. A25]|nr:unnamed protein product [Amoebophrya sp. A25]|eukprot:GSA25T00023202001.1
MVSTDSPAAYQILFMKEWVAETDEKKKEYYDQIVPYIKENCPSIEFVGMASKQYETSVGCPPNSFIGKWPSKDEAIKAYESMVKPDGYVKRDMRIIEGPSDMFEKGKSYWVAQFEKVIDQEKWNKYFNAFGAKNQEGFGIMYDDGVERKVSLKLKYIGPSDFKDNALIGEGNFFMPDCPDDKGLVIIAEFPDFESGLKIKECSDYKNVLLSALDLTYTTEEEYVEAEKRMMVESHRRDVRIFEIK